MGAHMSNRVKIEFKMVGDSHELEVEGLGKVNKTGDGVELVMLSNPENLQLCIDELLTVHKKIIEHFGGE